MRAAILAIGDELILGQILDTNSAWLAGRLTELGIHVVRFETAPDQWGAIQEAIIRSAESAELVLITGGLGPTDDDLTRDALAAAMHETLVEDPAGITHLDQWFSGRSKPMPAMNRRQALRPQTAELIANPMGTAPGLRATLHGSTVLCFPGVPSEMRPMFETAIAPIACKTPRAIALERIATFGMGESTVAELLGKERMARDRNPTVGTTATGGIVSVRLRAEAKTHAEAQRLIAHEVDHVEQLLGSVVFGRGDIDFESAVGAMLRKQSLTLTTAESCTAGQIANLITRVPGSSAWYLGGWVTYANTMKRDQLGVGEAILETHGAVSEPVARAMAEGALKRSGADLAVAVTGIAGPEGGTAEKPVGTVWFGLAQRDRTTMTECYCFVGDREKIRSHAALYGLGLVRRRLLELI